MKQLEAILADSAASMQAPHSAAAAGADTAAQGAMEGSSTCSKASKAAWWHARMSLDERLRCLLEDLDSPCLGPWMCVLPHLLTNCGHSFLPARKPTQSIFLFWPSWAIKHP